MSASGIASSVALPGRRDSAERPRRRVVVFRDGPAPKLEPLGGRLVKGDLDLEIRFENVNPLCFSYAVEGEPRVPPPAAWARPTHRELESEAPAPAYSSARQALEDVEAAREALRGALRAARDDASLDQVWQACESGGEPAAQRARAEAAGTALRANLGSGGAWRQALGRAIGTARAGEDLARQLGGSVDVAKDAADAARVDVERARSAARAADERLAAATRFARKAPADVAQAAEAAARAVTAAEAALRDADARLADARRARDLAEASGDLARQSKTALALFGRLASDSARADRLLAKAPGVVHRRIGPGEDVEVVVKRRRLHHGHPGHGPVEVHHVHAYETLHPILLDVGVGPALALGRNSAEYGLTFGPRDEDDNVADVRVHREEQGLNLDAMLSVSAYVWERRYLDDTVFDAMQLVPRPMVGFSLVDPLETIYTGIQFDPLQFVDITIGARWKNTERLLGPQVGDPALRDVNGDPVEPVTRKEVRPLPFVAVTFSTDLVHRWLARGVF